MTSSPTDSTIPAPSWPRTQGKSPSGSEPDKVYASVWHTAVYSILIRTSCAFGASTVISSTLNGFFASYATAAMHEDVWLLLRNQVRGSFVVVTRVRVLSKPWRVVCSMVEDNVSHGKNSMFLVQLKNHLGDIINVVGEKSRIELELVVYRIG